MKILYQTIVTAPDKEPVTVDELAFNERLITDPETPYDGPEKALLEHLITVAREDVENFTSRAIIHQQRRVLVPEFDKTIALCRNLVSIDSVKYLDSDHTQQTIDPSEYSAVKNQVIDYILMLGATPQVADRGDAVEIIFTTGMSENAEGVPGAIKQAIIMLAGHYYQNREATSPLTVKNVPLAYQWLLGSYRLPVVG